MGVELVGGSGSGGYGRSGQHCEPWFFVGMKRLLTGDQIAAAEDLKKSRAIGERIYVEHLFRQSELKPLAQ